MSQYGQVGWDVGVVGRRFRLVMGVLMTGLFVLDFVGGSHTPSLRTNVLTGLFFVGFVPEREDGHLRTMGVARLMMGDGAASVPSRPSQR